MIALEERVKNLDDDIREMKQKVNEMHALLMQARGARYVIVAAAAIAGGITSFFIKLIPWAGTLPK